MAKKTKKRTSERTARSKAPAPPKRKKGKGKKAKKTAPDAKKAKSGKRRRIAGFGYHTGPVMFVFTNKPGSRVTLVNDEMPKKDVRRAIKQASRSAVNIFIVMGAHNLEKLGSTKKPDIRVTVHDTPEVLDAIPAVDLLDAVREKDGSWRLRLPRMSGDELHEAAKASGYVPTHPKKIRELVAEQRTIVPSYDGKFDINAALDEMFGAIREDHRETTQLAVFRFLAGMSARRQIGSAKRTASGRLKSGVDKDSFRRLWSNVQAWIEDEADGRRVSAAYQLLAQRKIKGAPVAAARTNADLTVLNRLIRFITPSRSLDFEGWKYRPEND